MSESKRETERRRILKAGARLRLKSDSINLPEEFELVFVADGLAYSAFRKWRRGTEYGVAFTGEPRKVTVRFD